MDISIWIRKNSFPNSLFIKNMDFNLYQVVSIKNSFKNFKSINSFNIFVQSLTELQTEECRNVLKEHFYSIHNAENVPFKLLSKY